MESINFKWHKEKLQEAINTSDTEAAHIMADSVIVLIALDAANNQITYDETSELVTMYQSVSKWYA